MAVKELLIFFLAVSCVFAQQGVRFCGQRAPSVRVAVGIQSLTGPSGAPGPIELSQAEIIAIADRNVNDSAIEKTARAILGKKSENEFTATETLRTLAFILISRRSKRQVADCGYGVANSRACSTTSFREPTARCTSLTTKTWGMAFTPYARVLPPKYQDGLTAHRTKTFSSNEDLKSARVISTAVTTTRVVLNDNGVSAHTMQWGQFITHEFTLIAPMEDNVACCPEFFRNSLCTSDNKPITNQKLTEEQIKFVMNFVRSNRSDICIPVENKNDPVFGDYVCIHQDRSKIAPPHDCSAGPREQMNLITHVFDASSVYGSSEREASNLRTFRDGLLKFQSVNGATLPPCKENVAPRCPFLAGDVRVETTPNLIAYHSMWVVVHNRIANQLRLDNPNWNDERIYQEARRIIAGLMANIHFYEYLPIVIGRDLINKYRLGDYDGFDPLVNPSILNELAAAAMRFGHSTIGGIFSLIKDNMQNVRTDLEPSFFNNTLIYIDGVKQSVRGLTNDRPWVTDRNFPTQMRDKLFRKQNDIVSLNINRGRDHGFASYVDYRRHYRLSVQRSWPDLQSTHPADVVAALQTVYTTVDDIELYIGGVTENHVPGGLVGDTFGNILADGFQRSRKGDRLFFESSQSGLSKAQIEAIKKYKLSNFLCDGSDIDKVSSQGFFRIGFNGATETSCSSLSKLDLSPWRESTVAFKPNTEPGGYPVNPPSPKLTTKRSKPPTTTTTRKPPPPPNFPPYPWYPPCRPSRGRRCE